MVKIVTMSGIVLRLSIPNNKKLIQADEFDVNYGGGEADVAVSPANYGHEVEFTTAVPANPIGECVVAALRKYNVDTRHTVRNGERLGICFLETGSAMRASNVTYDRAHSSIPTVTTDQFNFDKIFADADWFHFTGITPAVSDTAIEFTEAALKAAKAYNATVSVDLNSHKELWSSEKAQKVMANLMQCIDVCVGNEEDTGKVLGFRPGNTDVTSGELELAGYVDIFNQMADKLGFKYIINSLRGSHSASDNGWSTCIMDGKTREFYHPGKHHITPIVNRVGSGNSFAAGLICGLVDSKDMKTALEYTVAASALEHTIPSGSSPATRADVEGLAGGNGSGRVQR